MAPLARELLHELPDRLTVEPSTEPRQEARIECLDTLRAVYCLPEEQQHAILLVAVEDLAAWVL